MATEPNDRELDERELDGDLAIDDETAENVTGGRDFRREWRFRADGDQKGEGRDFRSR